MSNDPKVEVARLQNEISKQLGLKPENVVFDYSTKEGVVKLDLITINPKHDQSFLYNSVKGIDQQEALQKMLDYVMKYHKDENSYTVQWMKIDEGQFHTSYFRAKNVYEVLDKFFFGRDMASYRIFKISLNPIS